MRQQVVAPVIYLGVPLSLKRGKVTNSNTKSLANTRTTLQHDVLETHIVCLIINNYTTTSLCSRDNKYTTKWSRCFRTFNSRTHTHTTAGWWASSKIHILYLVTETWYTNAKVAKKSKNDDGESIQNSST